jgi:hypothetical protein
LPWSIHLTKQNFIAAEGDSGAVARVGTASDANEGRVIEFDTEEFQELSNHGGLGGLKAVTALSNTADSTAEGV